MRLMLRLICAAMTSGLLVGSGCEEEPLPVPPPAPAPATQPEPDAPRRPTTQHLTDGAWKTVPLSVLPMTLRVPESWQPVAMSDANLLTMEGWTPSGVVQIRFGVRPTLKPENFESFVSGARKAMDARGQKKLRFELKENADFKVLEQQYAEDRRTMLATDERGNLIEQEGTPLKWSYLIFLMSDGEFKSYELNFVELSLEHYQQDREFLQRVMDSLAFDPSRKS